MRNKLLPLSKELTDNLITSNIQRLLKENSGGVKLNDLIPEIVKALLDAENEIDVTNLVERIEEIISKDNSIGIIEYMHKIGGCTKIRKFVYCEVTEQQPC